MPLISGLHHLPEGSFTNLLQLFDVRGTYLVESRCQRLSFRAPRRSNILEYRNHVLDFRLAVQNSVQNSVSLFLHNRFQLLETRRDIAALNS